MRRNQLWLAILVSLLPQAAIRAADPDEPGIVAASPAPNPTSALSKYLATISRSMSWSEETIDIDATIPRLGKRGHLRAIRRGPGNAVPTGQPEYRVLTIEGDRTVRQQVISRYLSAEVEAAAAIPPASIAISPANYRFRYRGSIVDGGALGYIFEITPKKKRAGLIRGQLWIDAAGLALRQTGYLVRRPSIFLRRVTITRDTAARGGVAYERTTHLDIDTRLV